MSNNASNVHSLPTDVHPSNDVLQSGYSQIPSDIMLPVINAMNENTRKIIDQQIDDNQKRHEAVKDLIKASEERAVQRALTDSIKVDRAEGMQGSTTKSEKGKSLPEKVSGLDVLCKDNKMSRAVSLWCCLRTSLDLPIYWGSDSIDARNSTFAVMLFGVQKCDGHLPYGTSLGSDLGNQARELASRLMWTARCSVMRKSDYGGKIPRWNFSLVPVCRQPFTGSSTRVGSIVSRLPTAHGTEGATLSDRTPNSGSTRRSEATIIDDYSDIADCHSIWNKERDYFKVSVAQGCRYVEQKKHRQPARKVSRIAKMDVSSEQRINRSLLEAQNRIADGAEAVRKECSKFLSTNRYNCRKQFYDAVGFMLFKFSIEGKIKANREGFVIDMPDLSDLERDTYISREKFNNTVPAAYTSDNEDLEIDEAKLRLIQDLIQKYPNLVVNIEYPVHIIDDVEGQEIRNATERIVPECYNIKETNSLISLSLVFLTEYTRSDSSGHFLRCSRKSLHAVLVIAIALRATVLRSLGQRMDPFESYIVGNVYFASSEVPDTKKDTSTILSFRLEESNMKRLKQKLSISKKRYLREEILNAEEVANHNTRACDTIFDDDDIFCIPIQEND